MLNVNRIQFASYVLGEYTSLGTPFVVWMDTKYRFAIISKRPPTYKDNFTIMALEDLISYLRDCAQNYNT